MAKQDDAGVTTLELAIITPLTLVILGGIIDFGLGLFTAYMMDHAAREGARYAAVLPDFEVGNQPTITNVRQFTERQVPRVALLSSLRVQVTAPRDIPGDGVTQDIVEVKVSGNYEYQFLRLIGLTNASLSRTSQMRYEWQALPS